MELYTIGVYNSTEKNFFEKLVKSKVDTFIDIRQRRGVRGAKYSFVNSKKLQTKLEELGIKYLHEINLAPTSEIREIQKKSDLNNNQSKQKRDELDTAFKSLYQNKIIDNFNFQSFIKRLKDENAQRIVLFCVEEKASACHRSLVATSLSQRFNINIINL